MAVPASQSCSVAGAPAGFEHPENGPEYVLLNPPVKAGQADPKSVIWHLAK